MERAKSLGYRVCDGESFLEEATQEVMCSAADGAPHETNDLVHSRR